jgi:3',5'-cyclic AMP phosphodiesterase CpdA
MLAATDTTDEDRRPSIRFAIVSDIHHLAGEAEEWLARVADSIRAQEPAFCLVLGDLVENGTQQELDVVKRHLDGLGMPVHLVIGNHDYLPDGSADPFHALFPGPPNYSFECGGACFIGLDTTAGTPWEETLIPEATFRWLDERLATLDADRPLVVFTHFPLADGVPMRPRNAGEVLARFRGRNLRAVFSGHYHGATGHRFQEAQLITGPCCSATRANHDGSAEKGYLLAELRDGGIDCRFIYVPVP